MNVTPFRRPENRQKTPPLFNIPPLTKYTLAGIVLIYLGFMVLPSNVQDVWGYRLAFVPARYTGVQPFDIWAILSPFTHLFLHGSFFHLAMNGLMLMAFGAASERMLGQKKVTILFILSGLAGALTQFALDPFTPTPMIGASGALSGLFAAVLIRLQQAGRMPAGRFGIWGVAALWIGLSLVSAFITNAMGAGNVAWAAHVGGFIAGMACMQLRYFH